MQPHHSHKCADIRESPEHTCHELTRSGAGKETVTDYNGKRNTDFWEKTTLFWSQRALRGNPSVISNKSPAFQKKKVYFLSRISHPLSLPFTAHTPSFPFYFLLISRCLLCFPTRSTEAALSPDCTPGSPSAFLMTANAHISNHMDLHLHQSYH